MNPVTADTLTWKQLEELERSDDPDVRFAASVALKRHAALGMAYELCVAAINARNGGGE